jgi:predicted MPP superfamily phosphohydrolase
LNHPLFLFRLVLFAVLALSQAYLFVRLRGALRGPGRWHRLRGLTVVAVGIAMVLFYVLNMAIVVRRLPWVDPPVLAQVGLLYPVAIWAFGSIFCALLLAVLRSAGHVRRGAGRLWRHLQAPACAAPVNLQRRRLLQAGVGALASSPLVYATYGAAAATVGAEVQELRLPFGRPLRLVQLTDIHAGLYMTREDVRRYAELVGRLRADVLALTGDYISTSMSFLPCLEQLARVPTTHGTFVTMGNHEHWNGDVEQAKAAFRRWGATVLDNQHRVIQTPCGPFAVAGIDDLSAGAPDLDAALRGLDPGVPTILLSHRPEVFPRAAERAVALTLAGHWHGGQIKLPMLGLDISIAHVASRYPEGLYRLGASSLYVSRGIGTTGPPIRLNAPPEVVLFTLA